MVVLMSSGKHYGFPSKFKQPRVSAIRDYPRNCGTLVYTVDLSEEPKEIADVQPSACRPVSRMYPPQKLRTGVPFTRDFPIKSKAPAALRNQMSDPRVSNSACVMSMADFRQSDVFNATNVHAY